MHATWELFFALLKDIACSKLPVAAALTGHSPAGGTVLAVCADYRVLAEGPFLVGLNEVQVGLPVPEVLYRVLGHVVGWRQAERLAVAGLLIGPAEALRVGLVDEVAPVADVVPRAVAWATELLSRPAAAMAATRALARRSLHEAFDGVNPIMIDGLVDQWFSPETQAVMQSLASRLAKKQS